MISVLHIIVGLDIGGAELMLQRLTTLPYFASQGVKHQVITLKNEGVLSSSLTSQGVIVHAMHINRPWLLPLYFLKLVKRIRKIRPDVVQTWMVHSDLLGGLAARLAGVRTVIWGVRTTDYSVESRRTRMVRWLCSRLSGIVPARIVCAAQASLLNSQAAGYQASKLMVIPNGFDVEALSVSSGAGRAIREHLGL
jgi:hypothetical protein